MNMKVLKVGGAVLKNNHSLEGLFSLLSELKAESIVVISAIGKTTRNLELAAQLVIENKYIEALGIVNDIINLHINMFADLSEDNKYFFLNNISSINNEIMRILKGIEITKEYSHRTRDNLLSKGEDLALAVIDFYLKEKSADFFIINSKDFLLTDSNFGSAKVDFEISKNRLNNIILNTSRKIYITQGFVGANSSAIPTTMGIESSNLTAVLVALFVQSNEITILTDVDGIYSIDPKLTSNAVLLNSMSIQTAMILAENGMKLLYPGMLELASSANLTLIFKAYHNKSDIETVISNSSVDLDLPIFTKANIILKLKNVVINQLIIQTNSLSNIMINNVSYELKNIIEKELQDSNIIPYEVYYFSNFRTMFIIFETDIESIIIKLHNLAINYVLGKLG